MFRTAWLILVIILFLLFVVEATAMTTGKGTVAAGVLLLSTIILTALPIYFGAYVADNVMDKVSQ